MMLRGLLQKELRQNAFTFAILFLLLLAGVGLIAGNHRLGRMSGSGLQGYSMLLWTLIPLASLTLGQVLIASEFRQRTQLFLEGLPLPRWRFIAIKYLLGLGILLLLGAAALGVVLWQGWEKEALTVDFALLLATKAAAWIFFLYAIFFAHAFLGRYRWAAAGAVAIILITLASFGLAFGEFAPVRLVDPTFPYERYDFPLTDLLWTVGIGAAFSAGGFALGLTKDATVASLLAERMSGREKGVVAILIFCSLMGSVVVVEKREETSPMHLPGAIVKTNERVTVSVAASADRPSAPEIEAMQAISSRLAKDLQALAEYLSIPQLPPVFVVHRRDYAADRLENGSLPHAQGLLVRANLVGPEFKEERLQRWLIQNLLLVRSEGRLKLERNAWLLDGFPRWWRSRVVEGTAEAISDVTAAEAARRAGLSADSPSRWYSIRKTAGAEPAEHLAANGLQVLSAMAGEAKMRSFLRAALGRAATKDVRTWFREAVSPWPHLLRRETGVTVKEFTARWQATADPKTTASTGQ